MEWNCTQQGVILLSVRMHRPRKRKRMLFNSASRKMTDCKKYLAFGKRPFPRVAILAVESYEEWLETNGKGGEVMQHGLRNWHS